MSDLKRRLLTCLKAVPERHHGDFELAPHYRERTGPLRPAAVLVGIVEHPHELTVLLTQRAEHLSAHAAQVAFPGGRIEPTDASPSAAALREAQEEIGLDPAFVRVIGALDTYETGTGFHIYPIVGLVRPGFTLKADAREVAEIFEVPLAFLMDPKNHETHSAVFGGAERSYYAMPYDGHYIWGATAGMIVNLREKLFLA